MPLADASLTLAAVRMTMAAVRSYSYHAVSSTTAQSGSSTTSTFTGKVVSPDRVRYSATTGRTTFEIIRIGATSYRRDPNGPWIKLPSPKNPPPSPAATLLAVLDRLGPVAVSPDGKVSATLSPRDANDAGLASGPGITAPVLVAMTIDASGHILHFDAAVKVSDAHTNSTLHTQTDFADFDASGEITAPV